jgi:hypothetical protein
MSDQEIVKHTKKAFGIWSNPNTPLWHKIKDFALEVFIIVFAVSLSIWFHNRAEHHNEQHQVRTFLLGLRQDIKGDITDVHEIQGFYRDYGVWYSYMSRFDKSIPPEPDSLKKALSMIAASASLAPHSSRFNGFLSAGKILNIESDSLTQHILSYYQEDLVAMKGSQEGWINLHNQLRNYLSDNVKTFGDDKAAWEVLTTPKAKYLTTTLVPWQQLLDRYQTVIDHGNLIIAEINEMYPDAK